MPRNTPAVPTYRRHRPSGQAVVTLSGKDFYLGVHGSAASTARYDRLVHEWLAGGRRLPGQAPVTELNVVAPGVAEGVAVHAAPAFPQDKPGLASGAACQAPGPASGAAAVLCGPAAAHQILCVSQLLEAYWEQAEGWYTKNGRETSHAHNIRDAMRPLNELYGLEPVTSFGPLALKSVRQVFIGRGLCRSTINKHVGTIRRIFKWGTENELVPPNVYHALQAVAGLRRGRSAARESTPVRPVPEEHVEAVLPYVSAAVAAMIRLQQVTGMRPGEVVIMRGCDLDTAGTVWTYTPSTHKTEHHGIERPSYLGPRAREIIEPFLKPDLTAYLFDPRQAVEDFHARRRAGRRTPMTPSQSRRRRKKKPKVAPLDHYTTESYRRAIARACRKADRLAHRQHPTLKADEVAVPTWHPHQLRHNAATRLRREYGLDVARVVLGHRTAAVTEMYAELDHARAREVMGRVG